ncbi:NDP-hexose 2,3-dehydratase family protein [Streptomyces sp. MB09-02B]|uniref:NDP-hexose 2,3-dehydratase family protein n=1 Tax=Streptomyces sp. MB09-02B TaxID=3028667 RepID=UPI0029B2832C|nr:NDP-hexose 2,3-dehydratase family protein [Streptomyces sp. MB09-02B]MDX3643158.1 NDP-hexose 2,3-dehydratase family protein [Streptomyces sp. MB09-02B]
MVIGTRTGADGTREHAEFADWLAERARVNAQRVEPIPFSALSGWDFDATTGDLRHHTGRFFSVRGLRVRGAGPEGRADRSQPIIDQPEIGVLGILTRTVDGVRSFLLQAKAEPGNVNGVQLSPTVQATRSNYTRVHRGGSVRYLEHFTDRRGRGRVLVDVLQSEQGSWFLRKRNRNMIVEVADDLPVHDDFRWLTLDEIRALLRRDNLVNMDARTVLSCLPPEHPADEHGALHSPAELSSWFTEAKTRCELTADVVPLTRVTGWHRTPTEIACDAGGRFRIIAVDVTAPHREVPSWSQPMLAPCARGLAVLLYRRIGGVPHFLMQALAQEGCLDRLEIGPTVMCVPDEQAGLPPDRRPPLLDVFGSLAPDRIRYDQVQSEEGGRFFAAENRYVIAELDDAFPTDVPPRFCWMTLRQLKELLRHSHYVNIEARTLVACAEALG